MSKAAERGDGSILAHYGRRVANKMPMSLKDNKETYGGHQDLCCPGEFTEN